jgi:hypothetical protein
MYASRGRPREYENQAERQAAYRERKAREGEELRVALARLRQAIRWARRKGKPVFFDAAAIDTEHQDSTVIHGLVGQITGRNRNEKLP